MAKGFTYRGEGRTAESVSRKAKQAGGVFDSYLPSEVPIYKPKDGENCIRVMPGTWEDLKKWDNGWDIRVSVHYEVGADKATYLCLDKMLGEPCPVCEARLETSDPDELKQLNPKSRVLCWVIDRDSEKTGPQLFPMASTMAQDVLLRSIDKKTGAPILIDHPDEGYDLVFTKEGSKLNTKYKAVEIMRDSTPLHDNQKTQQKWLDYITENDIPSLLVYYDYDYIKKVLYGKAAARKEEAEDETPSRGARASRGRVADDDAPTPRTARGQRVEHDDDGVVEDDDLPARGRGRASRDADDDEPQPGRGRAGPRRTALAETVDDETPFDGGTPVRGSRRRQVLDDEPADDEAEEPAGRGSAATARKALDRLKPAGRRS